MLTHSEFSLRPIMMCAPIFEDLGRREDTFERVKGCPYCRIEIHISDRDVAAAPWAIAHNRFVTCHEILAALTHLCGGIAKDINKYWPDSVKALLP